MQDNKWMRLLAYITGLVNQRLLLQCEYLAALAEPSVAVTDSAVCFDTIVGPLEYFDHTTTPKRRYTELLSAASEAPGGPDRPRYPDPATGGGTGDSVRIEAQRFS